MTVYADMIRLDFCSADHKFARRTIKIVSPSYYRKTKKARIIKRVYTFGLTTEESARRAGEFLLRVPLLPEEDAR